MIALIFILNGFVWGQTVPLTAQECAQCADNLCADDVTTTTYCCQDSQEGVCDCDMGLYNGRYCPYDEHCGRQIIEFVGVDYEF